MFHFFSARETPQLQEDMISEETKTKFSLPKSRKDFSHLIRGDLQKSKSHRDNFKKYSKKKYLRFQFPYFNTSKSVRTASQISLDDRHFGETKHVQVFPQHKNFHKLLRNKSTHSKERKFKRRNLPQLAHSPIKGTRKLRGSEFSIIDSENEGNMPVFPNFPQVSKLRKSISGSGKQRRSESLSYNENPEYPQKFISNIATLVSTSWS